MTILRGKHPMSRRHVHAIAAIAHAPGGQLSDEQLRAAIGAYATNVIKSLETERRLITRQLPIDGIGELAWLLTERGRQAALELDDELASPRIAATG